MPLITGSRMIKLHEDEFDGGGFWLLGWLCHNQPPRQSCLYQPKAKKIRGFVL